MMRGRQSFAARLAAFTLSLVMILAFTACDSGAVQSGPIANYGRYGSNLASRIAAAWPNRSPGSQEEKDTGAYLVSQLEDLGYKPVVESFSFTDQSGQLRHSNNISVLIEGQGFVTLAEEGKEPETLDRQVIVGAHYDDWFSAADVAAIEATAESSDPAVTEAAGTPAEPSAGDFNGIHDNASGIGTLMTLAKLLRDEKPGYDVVLVAFGAGEAEQAGAKAYVSGMSESDIKRTDAMYCVDSIYAGDKVYAHSGRNSLRSGYQKDYEKRRKLYEVTDVFYEFELYTNNNYMLYTNQASFDVSYANQPARYLYREWTLTDSDYIPFDDQDIPIVFFESFNYDGKSLADLKESSSPVFSATNGAIRHTLYDSSLFLKQHYSQIEQGMETEAGTEESTSGTRYGTDTVTETDAVTETDTGTGITTTGGSADETTSTETEQKKVIVDQLTKRINNTAFIIFEAIRKGIPNTVQATG